MQKEAQRAESREEKKRGRDVYEWVQALVCSVLTVVVVFTFAIRLIGVDGHSMVPTLQDGDRLMVLSSALCGGFRQGDIVVLRKESFLPEPIIKRIIATEGQTVDIDFSSGAVFVDGRQLHEDYILERTFLAEGTVFPLTVPEGCVFLMGDSRNASNDSGDARLGAVDERYLIGRAVFLAFPGRYAVTGMREYGRIGGIG